MSNIRKMFPGGNTCGGFFSYHDYIINDDANKVFILKGGPGVGKSTLMKSIASEFTGKNYSIEYHHCASDANSVDAIVIKELKVAILDGTFPHIVDPIMPGIMDKIINLGEFIDEDKLKKSKSIILEAKKNNKRCYARTYKYFRASREVLEEIAQINKYQMNFGELNNMISSLIEKTFNFKGVANFTGQERHLFGSAFTPTGLVDYTETLLKGLKNIYFIKGENGTGKSSLLEKIYMEGLIRGFDIEVFHAPLLPKKIQTIIIPQLEIGFTTVDAAFKFTHEVIDLDLFLDKKVSYELDQEMFEKLISIGISSLKKAKKNHDILEKCYTPCIDFQKIDYVKRKILKEILSYS